MKALIKCIGFIGDNLFASSIPEKLKQQGFNQVDMELSISQPLELIKLNPNIGNVYFLNTPSYQEYDRVFTLKPIHRNQTPVEQLQQQCGILNPTSSYTIHTNKAIDSYVDTLLKHTAQGKTLVAYMSNWEEKTFKFTKEEYKRGVDVPNLGYGGKRRDIEHIINQLNTKDSLYIFPVGMPVGYDQREVNIDNVSIFTLTASMIKACDWFIGAEGGLANLAAGVGTNTIITGDYVHQLYGWNGVIEQNLEPKLGPKYYFTEGHYTLDPYLSDEEVVVQIEKIIL